jgi:hypothetical protein
MPDIPTVVWISGTVGVGKTSVAEAMSEILKRYQIPHALIDRDALSNSWPQSGPFNEEVAKKNVRSVWGNFREAGAERLIVAGVIENAADLEWYKTALDPGMVLVRIKASPDARAARIRSRNTGASLEWHLYRTGELDAILDEASLEAFTIENEGRAVSEVAQEILERVSWLQTQSRTTAV